MSTSNLRRTASSRDFDNHPELVDLLKASGIKQTQSIKNKLTYALNSVFERQQVELAAAGLAGLADIRSFEYDGLVVTPQHGAASQQWMLAVLQIVEPLGFVLKPYRSVAELLELLALKHSYVPRPLWDVTWDGAARFYERLNELHRRLHQGETPSIVAAGVVKHVLMRCTRPGQITYGKTLGDIYKAAPGKDGKSVFFTFKTTTHGGMWEELHGKDHLRVEEHLVEAMCNVMGIPESHAYKSWVAGPFTSSIIGRIEGSLYDSNFMAMLDGEASQDKLMFACGRFWDLETFELKSGTPDVLISRHTGYDFPEAEMQDLERRLATAEVDLESVFEEVRVWEEANHSNHRQYPQDLCDRLKQAMAFDDFEIFRLLHDSFTMRGDSGETSGGWWVALFRGSLGETSRVLLFGF